MRRYALLLVVLFSLVVFSCKKEYTGTVFFWNREAMTNVMTDNGITELRIYADNELIGTQSPLVNFIQVPECGQVDLVNITKNLGSELSKSYYIKITDQNGITLWTLRVNIVADECYAFELTSLSPEEE